MSEILLNWSKRPTAYREDLSKERHRKYLKNELNSSQKMELYDCGVKGEIEKLKTIVKDKKYDLAEECSASGYYWTVLHYAAHYGFVNIVRYVVEHYKNHPNKLEILNLQSNLGLTPLMIAINNMSNFDKKKEIVEIFVSCDAVDFSICTAKGEDIIEICKKNNLLDYLYKMLKED